jgi:hypothetical protein
LDDLDGERKSLQDVVGELDRGVLVELGVDPQDSESGAVVDRGELVELASALPAAATGLRGEWFDELHVDLHPVPGELLLVALPASIVGLVLLRGRQPVHLEPLEDPPDAGAGDVDVVVSLEVHRDLARPEVVVLA